MPTVVTSSTVNEDHFDFFERINEDEPSTPYSLIWKVCNQGLVLPEEKVGNAFHLPACKLDGPLSQSYVPERREREEAVYKCQRLGWGHRKYLLVLPSPDDIDFMDQIALHPKSRGGAFLRNELELAGFNPTEVIVTHVCRFPLPQGMKRYRSKHVKACLPYLLADIYHINPDVMILCGSDSLKALYGKNAKLDTYRGNVLNYKFGKEETEIKVIPTVSHLAFLGGYANLSVFRSELIRARNIGKSIDIAKVEEEEKDYRVCDTIESVKELIEDIRKDSPRHIAVDTEFGNDYAREEYTYTLSIQLCWAKGKAAFIKLRDQIKRPPHDFVKFHGTRRKDGTRRAKVEKRNTPDRVGVPMFSKEDESKIWEMVHGLLSDEGIRLDGQHLRADVNQFYINGWPLDEKVTTGFDTMLVHHLLYGDEHQGLDHLVRKYVPEYGAYWQELEEWLGNNSRQSRLRFGYRDIPLDILIPYALKDADATWEIAEFLEEELRKNNKLWKLYWTQSAPTSLHLMDIERNGILIDEEQRQFIRDTYEPIYNDLLSRFQEENNWPGFNPRSRYDVSAFLYSDTEYSDKKDAPPGARVLSLKPLYNTDKYPKSWEEIEERGEQRFHNPSIKSTTLEVLQTVYPDVKEIKAIRQLSVIGKFLTAYLKPQVPNEFGVPAGGDGFHNNIWSDGRVRTHLSQLTQTGRYSSKAANLQTKPKKQEAAAFEVLVDYYFGVSVEEYNRRIEPDYDGPDKISEEERVPYIPFASCFIAPEDYCLIEADFKNAEIFIWAYCSGDKELIRVVDSGRDLHSEVACRSFNLDPLPELNRVLRTLEESGDIGPYKEWNKDFKARFESQRVAAKTVNFGVMYGRRAPALAREIIRQGVDVSISDCESIINGVANNFKVAWKWLNDNAEFAVENEYIENAFGRRRYFQGVRELSERDQASVKREAKNSPIQGTVADLLARAGINLYTLMNKTDVGNKLDFKILLPIHDAFLFEARKSQVKEISKAINLCMSKMNPVPNTDYRLKLDIEVMDHRWSDH